MSNWAISLGLFDILGVVFVVLKLVGVIDWSWWWVLLPFLAQPAIVITVILGIVFLAWLATR